MAPSEVLEIIATLKDCYPREVIGQRREAIYIAMLSDLEFGSALRAVLRVVSKSRFFPTIADIRGEYAAGEIDAFPADAAWAEVLAEVRRVGQYRAPKFSSDTLRLAVEAVGWEAICRSESPGVERAHFCRAYRSLLEREHDDARIPSIARSKRQADRLGSGEPQSIGGLLSGVKSCSKE